MWPYSTLCDPIDGKPTRLPRPWNSPGKNTGVGCHFLLQCMEVKSESEVAQSCPTLSNPMDCSLAGSSIHGIFQARVLEWGAIAFSDNCRHCLPNHGTSFSRTEGRFSEHFSLTQRSKDCFQEHPWNKAELGSQLCSFLSQLLNSQNLRSLICILGIVVLIYQDCCED